MQQIYKKLGNQYKYGNKSKIHLKLLMAVFIIIFLFVQLYG